MAEVDRILDQRYIVKQVIGKGSQGTVYKIETVKEFFEPYSTTGNTNVGKCFSALREDEALLEIEMLQMLRHVNIVSFIERLTENGNTWLITEWCDGGDLAQLIAEKRKTGTIFSEGEVKGYFRQIMQGVKYIHSMHVIHRDLKPSNIFLSAGAIKIGDFGIAKNLSPGDRLTVFEGTLAYMSPELLNGRGYSEKADLWSCGYILFEMCCLRSPFEGMAREAVSRAITDINARQSLADRYGGIFEEAFQSLVKRDPYDRMSAEAFLDTFFTEYEASRRTVFVVGKAGVGKSSLGNLIAGGSAVFRTKDTVAACSQNHSVYRSNDSGITIIDTIGLANPNLTEEQMCSRTYEALQAALDGVDVILFCMDKARMSNEYYAVFELLLRVFGRDCFPQLCLVITWSGYDYVIGKPARVNQRQTDYLDACQMDGGIENEMFRTIFNAAMGRVLFVENPPVSEIERVEETNKEARDCSRKTIIDFIQASNFGKFTWEATRRARLERHQRDELIRKYREECQRQPQTPDIAKIRKLHHQYIIKKDNFINNRYFRLFCHEMRCVMRSCPGWNELIERNTRQYFSLNSLIDRDSLLVTHRAICEICSTCEFCRLDSEMQEFFRKNVANIEEAEYGGLSAVEAADMETSLSELEAFDKTMFTLLKNDFGSLLSAFL